jgi:hypothetical protein
MNVIFQDELKIASSEEDKKYVVELFERGVQVIPTRYLFFNVSHFYSLNPLSVLCATLYLAGGSILNN